MKSTKNLEFIREFTKKLHRSLLPLEDNICKLEDLVFFIDPRKSFFFILSINAPFFILNYFHISIVSIFLFGLGIYFSYSHFYRFIINKFNSIYLKQKINEINPQGNIKRFNIAQISAVIGTILYAFFYLLTAAIDGLTKKNLVINICTLFIMSFLYFFFISIPDILLICLFVNLILFIPFFMQKKVQSVISHICS